MGRKKIEIDFKQVASMCGIKCTMSEIAAVLGVSEDTIDRRIHEEYGITFAEFRKQNQGIGKTNIRRKQYELAMKGDKTMLIWLGKQWLKQKDKQDITTDNEAIQSQVVLYLPDNGRAAKKTDLDE